MAQLFANLVASTACTGKSNLNLRRHLQGGPQTVTNCQSSLLNSQADLDFGQGFFLQLPCLTKPPSGKNYGQVCQQLLGRALNHATSPSPPAHLMKRVPLY